MTARVLEPVGYEALSRTWDLAHHPHHRRSFVGRRVRTTERIDQQERHIYPTQYRPSAEFPAGDIEFALKHEGLHLGLFSAVFEHWPREEIEEYVRRTPSGVYTRRVWFLYEWLTGRRLDLPDATMGSYVELLDSTKYYTARRRTSSRHRVHDNLLGGPSFCPVVRRTDALVEFESKDLRGRARRIVEASSPEILARASDYLYLKETRSSYAIERETPDQKRTSRFIELLRRAPTFEHMDEATLVELQNAIVDPRFANAGYRSTQNYVAETRMDYSQRVHFVPPRPEDLSDLMGGLIECHERLRTSGIDPVVHAALVSFGFVFLHPFDDGNGRLHRFLLHWILSLARFTPEGLVLPVSATMLAEPRGYDEALESFSRSLLDLVAFELDDDGRLTVTTDSAGYYRYFDATRVTEYLYEVLETTIERDLAGEIAFLAKHDRAKAAMKAIVELPNPDADLFFRLCLQNGGRLSKSKRRRFPSLRDSEVAALEEVIARTMLDDEPTAP